ncbi:hypothetical protein N24_1725 [Corynebacterium suranareeae]|uniref:Uncharacterized protein n=1 Tax=Corynebacterium suranareeae TaxID=2506452 RepID=A0A160PPM7_9CORY|nr:hypothetical protein N24_1725 [Corynebacterium suranareeae]
MDLVVLNSLKKLSSSFSLSSLMGYLRDQDFHMSVCIPRGLIGSYKRFCEATFLTLILDFVPYKTMTIPGDRES